MDNNRDPIYKNFILSLKIANILKFDTNNTYF